MSWSFRTRSYGAGAEGECLKKERGDKGMSGRALSKEREALCDWNMACVGLNLINSQYSLLKIS